MAGGVLEEGGFTDRPKEFFSIIGSPFSPGWVAPYLLFSPASMIHPAIHVKRERMFDNSNF